MQTYPIMDSQGRYPFAFEIENVYIGLREIGRLLRQLDGISDVHVRKPFRRWEDIHVWFKYMNRDYIVQEPFGDNSRYWIGPKETVEKALDVTAIENVFRSYRPSLHRGIPGDVLTLRLFKRLVGRT
jgi:hypothetical protein